MAHIIEANFVFDHENPNILHFPNSSIDVSKIYLVDWIDAGWQRPLQRMDPEVRDYRQDAAARKFTRPGSDENTHQIQLGDHEPNNDGSHSGIKPNARGCVQTRNFILQETTQWKGS